MKFASRSAMESESSAKAGSRTSSGKAAVEVPGVNDWLSRREVREEERRGVEGREGGLVREAEVERLWTVEAGAGAGAGAEPSILLGWGVCV